MPIDGDRLRLGLEVRGLSARRSTRGDRIAGHLVSNAVLTTITAKVAHWALLTRARLCLSARHSLPQLENAVSRATMISMAYHKTASAIIKLPRKTPAVLQQSQDISIRLGIEKI